MTTPAINTDMYRTVTGTHYIINSDGVRTDIPNQVRVYHHTETRPSSKTNRLSKSGWRQPSSWSHSVFDATLCLIGGSFRDTDSRQKPFVGNYYVDGAGWNESVGAFPALPGYLLPRAEIQALERLKNQKVNLAQAFAEREQTARLFSSAATKIARSVAAYRQRNPKKIWDLIVGSEGVRGRSIPRSWLELQYGWKPLMSDVYGSADALREAEGDGKAYRVTVHGSAVENTPVAWKKTPDVTGVIYVNVRGNCKQQVRVRLDYVLENPLLASLASIGVTNPVALAWELLPYSFVVDWFTPLGDWISSMDAALGYSFLGGTNTVYRRLVESGSGWSGSGKVPGNPYVSFIGLGNPSYSRNSFTMTRGVYSTSPLPRFPGIKNPLSTGHVANALALLVSSFK
jgi:hypothetical protein